MYILAFSFVFIVVLIPGLLLSYLKFRRRVPILMYHRIANVLTDNNALSPERFKEQLHYLKSNNYQTITMDDLYHFYKSNKALPKNPILLTFDDGYTDNFTNALPLLQEYQMKGIVFPISSWVGKDNTWEDYGKPYTTTMTKDDLKEWHNAGQEIGSHTVNHPRLSQLTGDLLRKELKESKKSLEIQLGIEINYLCYPYGNFNAETKKAAQQSGYKAALAILNNASLWNIDLFALPRISIRSYQSMWNFKLKVSRFHMFFLFSRQLRRYFKQKFR